MQLILASQSPRRKELLGLFHIPFVIRAADIDEAMDPNLPVCREVARVSRLKAEAVSRTPEDVVVAADTVVVCGSEVLGKPQNEEDAFRMLCLLSGKDHQVMTGLTVLRGDTAAVCTEITDIHFRALSHREIWAYIRSGEPMDKAGAYGIQGQGALLVEGIQGDYYTVVGLPVCKLAQMFEELSLYEISEK